MVKKQKNALIVASVASMIKQFNMNNITLLKKLGYNVEVAANFNNGNTCDSKTIDFLKTKLKKMHVKYHQIDFCRNALNIFKNINAYKQIVAISKSKHYDIVHCHSPIGGVITRLVFKKYRCKGTKIIYTAHGFHFYKGAPLINWLIYYPIEKKLSQNTDVLISITKDDYKLAKSKFFAKKTVYIPGVGIDIKKFAKPKKYFKIQKNVRRTLGLNDSDKLVLSVGELNKNKNHKIVIKAISKLNDKNIHYVIAGEGRLKDYLQELANKMNVNLHLLGFRKDVRNLYFAANVYCLPSIREGLNVSLMEAIASGLPCVANYIRGNVDLIKNNKNGYLCKDFNVDDYAYLLNKCLYKNSFLKFDINNKNIAKIDKSYVNKNILNIYRKCKN